MGGYKTLDSLDGECTHVIQTRQEYEMLLNQRDRAKREKEETERAAAREISRVKQEAAHEADRAAQRAQAQIDDLFSRWSGKRLKSPTSAPSMRTFSEFRGKEQMRIEGCDRKRYIPGMLS